MDGSCCSPVPWELPVWEMGSRVSGRIRDWEGQAWYAARVPCMVVPVSKVSEHWVPFRNS